VEIIIAEAIVADRDEGLLRVVLENLLGNAWKFTSKRADARIRVFNGQEKWRPGFLCATAVSRHPLSFNPQRAGHRTSTISNSAG